MTRLDWDEIARLKARGFPTGALVHLARTGALDRPDPPPPSSISLHLDEPRLLPAVEAVLRRYDTRRFQLKLRLHKVEPGNRKERTPLNAALKVLERETIAELTRLGCKPAWIGRRLRRIREKHRNDLDHIPKP